MSDKNKTLFIGPFAPPYNGDGIKNNFLKEGFLAHGYHNFIWFDTICRKGFKLVLLIKLFWAILKARQVILSINVKGRFAIIPFFWIVKSVFNKKGVLYVIGGLFDQQLENLLKTERFFFVKFLNSLDGIFVESDSLKKSLEQLGVKKVWVIYNPRKDSGHRWSLSDLNRNKAVFVSRVTCTKGVSVLIETIISLAKSSGHKINLDIYGPVDDAYAAEFYQLIDKSEGLCVYKGIIEPQTVQSTLTQYHFLALPTFHTGEGLPGILVEAGLAGIPIVITRFNALGEYFKNEESSILVEPENVDSLSRGVEKLIESDLLADRISKGIQNTTQPYRLESVMDQSIGLLKSFNWVLS